jgi:hypothetical protein
MVDIGKSGPFALYPADRKKRIGQYLISFYDQDMIHLEQKPLYYSIKSNLCANPGVCRQHAIFNGFLALDGLAKPGKWS